MPRGPGEETDKADQEDHIADAIEDLGRQRSERHVKLLQRANCLAG